jgi:hypothetical protein
MGMEDITVSPARTKWVWCGRKEESRADRRHGVRQMGQKRCINV